MQVHAESTALLRKCLRAIYDVCEQCDAEGIEVQLAGVKLTVRRLFEIEVTAYLFYLAAADRVISQEEVDFINGLMGRGYSLEMCSKFVAEHSQQMTGEQFAKTTPLSFKILTRFTAGKGADISDVLISFYEALGHVLAASDSNLATSEQEARTNYVYLLRGYKMLSDTGE